MGERTIQRSQSAKEAALYLNYPDMIQRLPVWRKFSREMTVIQRSLPINFAIVESPQLIYWVIHLLKSVGLTGTSAANRLLDPTNQILVRFGGRVLMAALDSQPRPGKALESPGDVALEIGFETQSGGHPTVSIQRLLWLEFELYGGIPPQVRSQED